MRLGATLKFPTLLNITDMSVPVITWTKNDTTEVVVADVTEYSQMCGLGISW